MTLRAILFDFDGVLADTEPLHLEMFCAVLRPRGIRLTEDAYKERFLGLDDRDCFRAVFKEAGQKLSVNLEEELVREKNVRMLQRLSQRSWLLPGATALIKKAAEDDYLAIVSGALKSEIEAVLKTVESPIQVIVSAEEVSEGKPSPEGFLKAIRLLNRDFVPESEILLPEECLAIEDSPWGIEAARKAEIRCAAVATSYPPSRLKSAEWVFQNLERFDLPKIRKEF